MRFTPDTEQVRKLLAELERMGRAYRSARVAVYELAEEALNAGATKEDVHRASRLSRPTLRNIERGRSQMDKPPSTRLEEWRNRDGPSAE